MGKYLPYIAVLAMDLVAMKDTELTEEQSMEYLKRYSQNNDFEVVKENINL